MTFSRFDDPPMPKLIIISVDNALEHRNYALFYGILQTNGDYKAVSDNNCLVRPIGKDFIFCTTKFEFEGLVDKYFNIRQ